MSELGEQTRQAVTAAMRAAGFSGDLVYRRPAPAGFEFNAQGRLDDGDDGAVTLSPLVWLTCPAAEDVLTRLGRDEVPWVRRDPGRAATIRRPEEIETAVAELLAAVEATAAELAGLTDVDAFAAAVRAAPDMTDDAPAAIPVVLAVHGREAEARRALDDYRGEDDFAARFAAWLDDQS